MNRRHFMAALASGAGMLALGPHVSVMAAAPSQKRLLVLVELKGGNDGLNTLVPYADPAYFALRPRVAIARDAVLQLSGSVGLHPALQPLMPMWEAGELAVLQGVGYPAPNLSHFRSIEIWHTASGSQEVRQQGWLARAFELNPGPASYFAEGVRVGQGDMGPLAGSGVRSIALANIDQFLRQARMARPVEGGAAKSALGHIMQVDQDIAAAAGRIQPGMRAAGEFPKGAFGEAVKTACQVLESGAGVGAICLTLNGFDTHQNQLGRHAALLRELGEGLAALKNALVAQARWRDTLVLTYAEFGRRPKENQSGGTDHGTASVHFACGGAVRGGLYGAMPSLNDLDGSGNLRHTLDFRGVYATVLNRWWGMDAQSILGARHSDAGFLRA